MQYNASKRFRDVSTLADGAPIELTGAGRNFSTLIRIIGADDASSYDARPWGEGWASCRTVL